MQVLADNQYGQKFNPEELQIKDRLIHIQNSIKKPLGSESYHIYGHLSNGMYKGYKFDVYEGGHRIPFIVKWKDKFTADTKILDLVSTLDIFPTLAEILEFPLDETIAEDGYSFLPQLKGHINDNPREVLIHKGWKINTQAIRSKDWKLIPYKNGGGLYKFPDVPEEGQLYNLNTDPGETQNIYNDFPEIVKKLQYQMDSVMRTNRFN